MAFSNVSPEAAYLTKDNIAYPDTRAEVVDEVERLGRVQLADESGVVTFEDDGETSLVERSELDPEVNLPSIQRLAEAKTQDGEYVSEVNDDGDEDEVAEAPIVPVSEPVVEQPEDPAERLDVEDEPEDDGPTDNDE